ncbi:TPM domain-containing protein [Azonexus sp.]|uniref:TPM domain-containing protein n=1 Tax=Azonexus sp. TaxID=1872668 RepID=UPI0035B3208D
MGLLRKLKHLTAPGWLVRRHFGKADLDAVEAAIAASEKSHRGEICVVIEGALPYAALWHETDCRQRAGELFREYGIDRTREATGILLYIQLLDHQLEILADHGISAQVPQAVWDEICHAVEREFAAGRYREGTVSAIGRIGALLAEHFPATADDNPDELANRPRLR